MPRRPLQTYQEKVMYLGKIIGFKKFTELGEDYISNKLGNEKIKPIIPFTFIR